MSKTRIGALAEIDPVDPFERTLSERDDSPHYAAVLNDEQLLLDPDSQPNPKKQYMLPNDRERDVLPVRIGRVFIFRYRRAINLVFGK